MVAPSALRSIGPAPGSRGPAGLIRVTTAVPRPMAAMLDLDGTTLSSIPLIEKAFGTVNYWIKTASTGDPGKDDLREGIELLHGTMGMMLYTQVGRMVAKTTRSRSDLLNTAKVLSDRFRLAFQSSDPILAFSAISEAFMLAELQNEDIPLLPGAEDMVRWMYGKGILVYIGTGNFRSLPELVMGRHRIRECFTGIFGEVCGRGSSFPGGKNDMLEKVRLNTGLNYNQIMMFGDGENDMRATKINGSRFIGVGLTGGRPERGTALMAAGADFLIPDLSAWRAYLEPLGFPK